MKTKEIAEKIRSVTMGYIREHGIMLIEDDDEDTSYKQDIIEIIEGRSNL